MHPHGEPEDAADGDLGHGEGAHLPRGGEAALPAPAPARAQHQGDMNIRYRSFMLCNATQEHNEFLTSITIH